MSTLHPLGERERFVAFAFAAAEMLIEADACGTVLFATGAVRVRLGRPPDALIGLPVEEVVALADQPALRAALEMIASRGRLEPTTIRLADGKSTPFVISGLYLDLPGHAPRICLSLAPPPLPLTQVDVPPTAGTLIRHAEGRMRRAAQGHEGPDLLGLIEIKGQLPPELLPGLNQALSEAGGACLAAEVAPGRYSVMPGPDNLLPDLSTLPQALEALLPNQGLRNSVRVDSIPLSIDGLSPMQAARALRHCLSTFATGGTAAVRENGFADGLSVFVADAAKRSQALRRALRDGRFQLQYQPICVLADGVLHHYEALLRPEKGILGAQSGPGDFVNLAEMVGLTEELDLAVLGVAMRATPLLGAGQHIAVNISGLSMQSETFRTRLLAALDAEPAATARIMVELTETAEIEHEAPARATMLALRQRGVPLCLDDFGAGAAAFRYLKSFPVDYVKVDGAFVEAAVRQERDRSFVAAMVDLSLAVGAQVIAEFIETEQHSSVMLGLGVAFGQGWHLGRPGPIRAAEVGAGKRGVARESWG
jgi:EAL domain-containing protein (putative c-di-GMP-specific phosphodiesterase class I)